MEESSTATKREPKTKSDQRKVEESSSSTFNFITRLPGTEPGALGFQLGALEHNDSYK